MSCYPYTRYIYIPFMHVEDHNSTALRVRQRQKPVLVSNFTCKNKNGIFVKEVNTSGYILAWTIYTLHIDKFAHKHTFFHYSAACLSVIFELLPGLILFTSLWAAG